MLYAGLGAQILRFAGDGGARPPLIDPFSGHALTFSTSGELFSTSSGRVLKFSPAGSQQWVDSLAPYSSSWSDLDSEQCTLYYLDSTRIRKYDVCNRVHAGVLPTVLPENGGRIVILTDGTLLISTDQSGLYRVATDGAILRHYATRANVFVRDSDANFVWVSVPTPYSGIARFDVRNDSFASSPFITGVGAVPGISLVTTDPASIPAVSPTLLAMLAFALIACAVIRLHAQ